MATDEDRNLAGSALERFAWRTVRAHGDEVRALLAAFAYLFCLFAGYALLRPVRETMGITSGVANLPALFWGTFIAMLAVQPLYGWMASRLRRTVFLPWVYGFFVINLLLFYVWFQVQDDHTWIARAFFIWLSVFVLFVVSVFWSFMADIFHREQAKRLYGFIAAGASTGGIVGPAIAATLAPRIGSINLLLIAAVLLTTAIFFMRVLIRWHADRPDTSATAGGAPIDHDRPVGGNPFAGFYLIFRNPYLLGIAVFVFLLTWVSTFLYLQQAELVSQAFQSPDQQTRVFGWVDFSVQALSLLMQVFALSRLASRYGLKVMLVIVPVLMVGGFILLATSPVLAVLLGVMIVRRVGEYSITRPCREMLFTTVDRETKYKAKNFIDTVVYRAGDAISGSVHAGLVALLGLTTSGVAWAGAVIAAVWAAVAYQLGRRHESEQLATAAPAAAATRIS